MTINTYDRFVGRQVVSADELKQALKLRGECFRSGANDVDRVDDRCTHFIILDNDEIVCTFRVMMFEGPADISYSYSAQHYDLTYLFETYSHICEVGRFCVSPNYSDPNAIRTAWAVLTKYVDENNIGFMFGCTSFWGLDVRNFTDAFSLLRRRYVAPETWKVKSKSQHIFNLPYSDFNQKKAISQIPPLLRTYLKMGAKVSDHAVIDRDLNTLHVFTGLDLMAVPQARAKALRMTVDHI